MHSAKSMHVRRSVTFTLHLLSDAEPLREVDLAAIDTLEEIANRIDSQTAVLQLGDQLEPLEMRLAVVRDAAADLWRHQCPPRLIGAPATWRTRRARSR